MAVPDDKSKAQSPPLLGTIVLKSHTTGAPTSFQPYSIVGVYADSGPAGFVRHLALLKDNASLNGPEKVDVYHMGPPIVAGPQSATAPFARRSCRADILSDIALDAEERESIEDWLAEVEKEDRTDLKPFQQYVVVPHVAWVVAPETGRRIRRRFSCVGFVIECYAAAAIVLVDTGVALPDVDEATLKVAYEELARIEANDRLKARCGFKSREDLGLHGIGPWKVVLAGYVFHSLKRVTIYTPRPGAYVPGSVGEGSFSA